MGQYSGHSDNELADLLRLDDRMAFNELYERYWKSLYQMTWNVLRDRDTCMEVIQVVFVWIWEHRLNLEMRSPAVYIRFAVKYKTIDILRSNRVREACFVNLQSLDTDFLISKEAHLEIKELKAVIAKLSSSLPERARLIFELSRNEELSNREIATKLNISEKTVENQMTIALRKLRAGMKSFSIWIFLFLEITHTSF